MASQNTVEIIFNAVTGQAVTGINSIAASLEGIGRRAGTMSREISTSAVGVTSYSRAVAGLGPASTNAAAGMDKIGTSLSGSAQKFEDFGRKARLPAEALAGTVAAASGAAASVERFGTAGSAAMVKVSSSARLTTAELSRMLKSGEIQAKVAGMKSIGDAAATIGTKAAGAGAGVDKLSQQLRSISGMFAGVKIGPSFDALLDSVHKVREEVARLGRATPESLRAAQQAVEQLTKTYGANLQAARGLTEEQRKAFASARDSVAGINAAWTSQSQAVQAAAATGVQAMGGMNRAAQAAAAAGTSAMGGMATAISAVGRQLLLVLGPIATLAGAFALLKKAISNADELRDLAAGIRIVSGSATEAAATLKFFEENARRTRSTNDELAESFRELFPSAKRMGFDAEEFREMTVTIHNFATAINKDVGEVQAAFVQLTSGRITGTNVIVKALGDMLDPRALAAGKVSINQFLNTAIEGMRRTAAEGEKMGQTLTSTFKLLGDRLQDAFGEGFNRASGKAQKGMQGVLDALTDPKILDAIGRLGEAFATLAPLIATALDQITRSLAIFAESTTVARLLRIVDAIEKVRDKIRKDGLGALLVMKEPLVPGIPKDVRVGGASGTWGPPKSVVDPDEEARLKRLKDAAEQYAKALDAMLNRGDAWRQQLKMLDQAIGILSQTLGRKAAIKAFAPELEAISKQAKKTGTSLGVLSDEAMAFEKIQFTKNALEQLKQLEETVKALPHLLKQVDPAANQAFRNAFNKARNEFQGFLDDAERDVAAMQLEAELTLQIQTIKEPLGNIFADAFTTGGKNFANIFAKTVEDQGKVLGASFTDAFVVGLGALTGEGTRIDPTTGRPVWKTGSMAGQIGGGLMTGAATGYGLYRSQVDSARAMKSQDIGIQASMAFATTYATSGSWISAVVALAVSAVMGHMGQAEARDLYKFAVPGIDEYGMATLTEVNKNISQADEKRMIAQIQERFDAVWNGMVSVVAKWADKLPDLVTTIDGRFQSRGSANFLRHFDSWLNETLPREVAAGFKAPLQGIAESLGYSTERFNEIWAHLEQLDPNKAAALWESLFSAAKKFQDSMAFFRTPLDTVVGPGFDIQPGMYQQVFEEMNRSFATVISETDDQLIKLGFAMKEMTGEAQIQTAKQLGDLLDQRMKQVKDFINEIAMGIESITKSFEASIRELELEGMKTPEGKADTQKQVEFLEDYSEELLRQMNTATSGGQIQAFADELRATILRIKQLGGTMGGDAEEQYRLWAIEALKQVQQQAIDRMKVLAQELEDQNAHFVDAIQGFIDAFLTATKAFEHPPYPITPPTIPTEPPKPGPGGEPRFEPFSVALADAGANIDEYARMVNDLGGETETLRRHFRSLSQELADSTKTTGGYTKQAGAVMDTGGSRGVVTPEFERAIEATEQVVVPTIDWDAITAGALAASEQWAARLGQTAAPLTGLSDGALAASVALQQFREELARFEMPPFEWPVLEVPPFAWPTVYAPDFDAPTYKAPTFEPPVFKAPVFTAPTFEAPIFKAPTFEPPIFKAPVFDAPVFTAPTFEAPTFEAPTFDAPTFTAPTFEPPTFTAPTFDAPIYEAPIFDAPTFEPPVFKAPTFDAPIYKAPVFEAPIYEPPAFDLLAAETEILRERFRLLADSVALPEPRQPEPVVLDPGGSTMTAELERQIRERPPQTAEPGRTSNAEMLRVLSVLSAQLSKGIQVAGELDVQVAGESRAKVPLSRQVNSRRVGR